MTTEYSGRVLSEKLNYKPGETLLAINALEWFVSAMTDDGIAPTGKLPTDWAHAFCHNQSDLWDFLQTDLTLIEKGFWVSWPKKSSGVETDLTEQDLRDFILPLGWVDTKVCAVDDTWSGLKFLRRKQ